nr:MAG TPA: hypothetical protein [Bacteriophage sp.]
MRSNFIVEICDPRRKIEIISVESSQKILRRLRICEFYHIKRGA